MSVFNITDGNGWEARVLRWLHIRHPNDIQPIPSLDGGDGGLECFCISQGIVYQCYSPLGTLDTKSLYENQRDKLTREAKKFIDNSKELMKLFPKHFKVKRYAFVVPEIRSKKLVGHASSKCEEVKQAQLPYVDADFSIIVWDSKVFEPEAARDRLNLIESLNLDIKEVSSDDLNKWSSENNDGFKNLNRKIPLCTNLKEPGDIQRKIEYWIEATIVAENALEKLRSKSEEIWEKLWDVRRRRERMLAREFGETPGEGSQVRSISDQLVVDMLSKVPNLEKIDAETLADGLVGDWLQKCNIDFPSKD